MALLDFSDFATDAPPASGGGVSVTNTPLPRPNPRRSSRLYVVGSPQGLVQQGNIDLLSRPKVKNPNGGISTVRSASFNIDGREVLIPTVSDDGRLLSDEEAIAEYQRTGRHLGKFESPDAATAYADALHKQQDEHYQPKSKGLDFSTLATDKPPSLTKAAGATAPVRSEFKKGLVGSLIGTNPKLAGDAAEGFGLLLDSETMVGLGRQLAETGKAQLETRQPAVPSFTDIRTDSVKGFLESLGAYAAYQTGSALGSSAPSIVVGLAGAALTSNPIVGVIAGAAGPSYIQNYGDVYGSVRDDPDVAARVQRGEITPKQIAGATAVAAIPMAALDTFGIGKVLGETAFAEARRDLISRIAKGIATGTIVEGSTEGLQEVISQWAQWVAGSERPLMERIVSVVDNAIAGALGGGVIGGVGGAAREKPVRQPQPAAGAVPPPPEGFVLEGEADVPAGAAPAETLYPEPEADITLPETVIAPEPGKPISSIPPGQTVDAFGKVIPQPAAADAETRPADAGPAADMQKAAPDMQPADAALLKGAGYSDDDIAEMGAEEIAGAVEEAKAQGVEPAAPDFTADAVAAGSKAAPVTVESAADLDAASATAATDYTPAQGEANNRQLGHVKWKGLPASIEVAAGGVRKGTNPKTGEPWSTTHTVPYGYWNGTKGGDDMAVDVYWGPEPEANHPVYVLDELDDKTGAFRQHKTFAGFPSEQAARDAYLGTSTKKPEMVGGIKAMSVARFKAWLRNGDTTKPLGEKPTITPSVKGAKPAPEAPPAATKPPAPATEAPAEAPAAPQTAREKVTRPAAKARPPQSLTEFLAANGGIKDFKGELRAIGLADKFIPRTGRLVRKKGRSLDYARERAAEAGYFDAQYGTRDRAASESTVADLLDLLDRENNRGERIIPPEDQAEAEEIEVARRNLEARGDARDMVDREMFNASINDDEVAELATEILLDTGVTAEEAIERASIQLADEVVSAEDKVAANEPVGIPFFDEEPAPQPGGLPESRGRVREAGEKGRERPGSREGAEDRREKVSGRGADEGPEGEGSERQTVASVEPGQTTDDRLARIEARIDELSDILERNKDDGAAREEMARLLQQIEDAVTATRAAAIRDPAREAEADRLAAAQQRREERGADGRPQGVLPGTERIADAELAQRRADQPLKPRAAQKPADEGLFSDDAAQTDLVDRARRPLASAAPGLPSRPPFYSAVLRAVDGVKITKGTPDQWLATIRNTPGVKQEELDWIGLEDWLKGQSGTVTREAVAAFVRANQIEVRDIVRDAMGRRPTIRQADAILDWIDANQDEVVEEARTTIGLFEDGAISGREVAEAFEGYGVPDALLEPFRNYAGGEGGPKFSQYQLPGGENYRELLLTLPVPVVGYTVKPGDRLNPWIVRHDGRLVARAESEAEGWESARSDAVYRAKKSDGGAFKSPHFDEPNVLAHGRFNDRVDAAGKRTLFIEEIQSDWHQAGRKKGYQSKRPPKFDADKLTIDDLRPVEAAGGWQIVDGRADPLDTPNPTFVSREAAIDVINVEYQKAAERIGVPDAPFKTTWPELALKRMIRWAAENGYDQVAWTPGDVQNQRYESSLRQAVNVIEWQTEPATAVDKPLKRVIAHPPRRESVDLLLNDRGVVVKSWPTTEAEGKTLEDLVGKEIARQVLAEPQGRIEGEGLMIGGEGMRAFYDRILVNAANKLGKKFGARAGQAKISTLVPGEGLSRDEARAEFIRTGKARTEGAEISVHALPITPVMRDAAMQGQPLFNRAPGEASFIEAVKIGLDEQARIARAAAAIIRRIAGRDIGIQFHSLIPVGDVLSGEGRARSDRASTAAGFVPPQTAGGFYDYAPGGEMPADAVIGIALNDPIYDPLTTAGHESWHHVESALLTDSARATLTSRENMEAMRALAAEEYDLPLTSPFLDERPGYEIRAIAFQRYRRMREEARRTSLPSGVRRVFDRLLILFKEIKALVARRGLTFEDIFEKARLGGYSEHPARFVDLAATEQAPRRAAASIATGAPPPSARVTGAATATPPAATTLAGAAAPPTFWHHQVNQTLRRVSAVSDRVRIKLQDRMLALRRIQEEIEAAVGAFLPTNLNTYLAEALYHGRAGERLINLRRDHVEPLVEAMQAAEVTLEDLGEYLYARHAEERNAAIRTIDPANDAGSGMTDAEAQATLSAVHGGGKAASFRALARRVDSLLQEARSTMLRAGLIDQATFDAWTTQYRSYVPLRGFETDGTDVDRPRTGRGFDVRGPEAQQALGRRSVADNPLAYAIMQAQQAIVRAEKNRVAKTMLRMVQSYPNPDLWRVVKAETKRRVSPTTGLVETYAVQPAFSRNDNLFAVKVGGKTTWIEIADDRLARAMRGVGIDVTNPVLKAAMKIARVFSALQTQWNPEFVFSNMARDLQTAVINVGDVEGLPAKTRRQTIKDALTLKSIRGILAALYNPGSNAEYARYFEEYRLAGGKVSFIELNDVQRIKADIDKAVGRGEAMTFLRKGIEAIENVNTAVENGARLSVYIHLRKAGMTEDKAAGVARDLTVDFNRKGEWGALFNTLYLFFNAATQGTFRMARAVARSRKVQAAVVSIFAAGALLDMLNYLLSDDDDDGKSRYDKIAPWVKERNIVIMFPGDPEGRHILIPMAYGYNFPFLAGQQLMAVIRGARKPGEAAATAISAAMNAFNPIGDAPSLAQYISPTIIDPIVQIGENLSWYGGPIYPTKFDRKKPDAENYFRSVPEWAKTVSRVLNEATGGNVGRSGSVLGMDTDISPEVIQHYVEFAGGGSARFFLNAFNTAGTLLDASEWLPEDTPFLRRVYAKETSGTLRREFYEAWDEVDSARYEITRLRKAGEHEAAQEAQDEYEAEIRAHGRFKSARKQLDAFEDQIADLERDTSLSADEMRRRRDELVDRQNRAAQDAITAYEQEKRAAGR